MRARGRASSRVTPSWLRGEAAIWRFWPPAGVVVGGFPDAGPAATLGSGDAAGLSVIVAGECENDNWLRSGHVVVPATVDLTLPGGVLGLPVPDDVGHQFRPDGLCPFMVSGFEHWLR